MTNAYTIGMRGEVTYIKFHQLLPLSYAKVIVDDIIKNYNYKLRLWDMSEVNFDFTHKELMDMAAYGQASDQIENKLALVVPGTLEFAEMRQFGAYRVNDYTEFGLFHTVDEALKWLNS